MRQYHSLHTFYRCCYRFPDWSPGHCKQHDGFAREHWSEDLAAVEQTKAITEQRGGEAFIEKYHPETGDVSRLD